MPTLPPLTPLLCVNLPHLALPNHGLSTVGCELPFLLSPLLATLTVRAQLTENKRALSPFPATLTSCVNHKSFVCHSYKKHRGVGYPPFLTLHSSLAAPHFLP